MKARGSAFTVAITVSLISGLSSPAHTAAATGDAAPSRSDADGNPEAAADANGGGQAGCDNRGSTTETDASVDSDGDGDGTAAAAAAPYETVVTATAQPAATEPLTTYPQLVSGFDHDPRVDVQARFLGETQADVSVRGGIFENTALALGAVTIFDPQTGHYLTELPVPPAMLQSAEVLVGADNAMSGVNAGVGTLRYGWKRLESRLEVGADLGPHLENYQEAYVAKKLALEDVSVGADFELARAAGDGEYPGSELGLDRVAGRAQIATTSSQTDLFAGYEHRRVSWPYLYAVRGLHEAIGTSGVESDAQKTLLLVANHRASIGARTSVEASAYYRRNDDDYELDRSSPGLFNPYEHRTTIFGAGVAARHELGPLILHATAQVLQDRLASSALTFGPFTSRRYVKLGLTPEVLIELSPALALDLRAGAVFDDTNRDTAHVSPLATVALRQRTEAGADLETYVQYAQATQVPGYTAIASDPDHGLFRGNSGLGRQISDTAELGVRLESSLVRGAVALFHRRDRALVDWTYDSDVTPFAARQANAVDIATTGVEAVLRGKWSILRWAVGYAYLGKIEDYGDAAVDASFYALNYPRHRATLSLVARPLASVQIETDVELRDQMPNALRDGPTRVALASGRLVWMPELVRGLRLSVGVDNALDAHFQEVPGVPATGRRLAAGLAYVLDL